MLKGRTSAGVLLLVFSFGVITHARVPVRILLQDDPNLVGKEPGSLNIDEDTAAAQEAAFQADMAATQGTTQEQEAAVPESAEAVPAAIPEAAAVDPGVAEAVPSDETTETIPIDRSTSDFAAADPARGVEFLGGSNIEGNFTDDGEEVISGDEEDWFWEEWDNPDKDTWFYNMDDTGVEEGMGEEGAAGWNWDDPVDEEGDHNWDTEWAPQERDDSLTGRMNATLNAMSTHVAPSVSQTMGTGKAIVRAGVSQVLQIEDHPKNYVLLEVLTFLPLVPPLLLILFLIKAASDSLSMHGLVQFACWFCAGYTGLLIFAAFVTGDEPLSAFQFMAGHGPYIKYQFLVATAYMLYLILLYVNVCVQRCGATALVQQVCGTSIGLHYYLGTFHTAMVALPPESVLGIPAGVPTYFAYSAVFFVMGCLPQRQKEMTEEAEDDKAIGEGKAQD